MAVYVYRCRNCQSPDVEVSHRMSENPEVRCDCGARRGRAVTPFGFALKGDGWAGKPERAGIGVEGKVPPARPVELGGTLDTSKRR
jgi:putative FmdB family regulatory protein